MTNSAMPTSPCRFPYWALALCLPILLSACVTTGGPAKPTAAVRSKPTDGLLNQLGLLLPGRYGNFQQVHSQKSSAESQAKIPLLNLVVSNADDQGERLDFSVEQHSRQTDQGASRGFLWQVVATEQQLVLRITPRGGTNAPCDIPLQAVAGGFAGQSDPRLCSIPSQQGPQLGIRKEVAIKPGQLSLADQVVDLTTGQVRLDTRLEFQRLFEFDGWAGVKGEDGEWQLAQAFTLHNDGDQVLLRNPSGHSLGVRLQLARVSYRDDQPAILRLAVFKEDTVAGGGSTNSKQQAGNSMVAYGWADPNSPQVGINLDWFQAGLSYQREP